ncbi:hypothetical protein F5Y09DRAFT_107680 [Xylaria sp. FL1042]|nr:hypothetical protein F5Y09DRAFT_107680 [Xylaria sp. FL1042]
MAAVYSSSCALSVLCALCPVPCALCPMPCAPSSRSAEIVIRKGGFALLFLSYVSSFIITRVVDRFLRRKDGRCSLSSGLVCLRSKNAITAVCNTLIGLFYCGRLCRLHHVSLCFFFFLNSEWPTVQI